LVRLEILVAVLLLSGESDGDFSKIVEAV